MEQSVFVTQNSNRSMAVINVFVVFDRAGKDFTQLPSWLKSGVSAGAK